MKQQAIDVTISKEQVIQALKQVYDPEIPVDIYALGLIYEITIYPVNNVQVVMTLTSPSCPAAKPPVSAFLILICNTARLRPILICHAAKW